MPRHRKPPSHPAPGRNDRIRETLLQRQAELLKTLRAPEPASIPPGAEEQDLAHFAHEEFISTSLSELARGELRLVEAALVRLKEGDFGICCACDEPIPDARLRSIPWALYCVPCAETEPGDRFLGHRPNLQPRAGAEAA